MADIIPFQCVRPAKEYAARIAALPYDVYSRKEAKREIEREPLSFLKIDRAEAQLDDSVDMYSPQVYQKARESLEEMIAKGLFVTDLDACYYIYEMTMNGRSQTGITACASIDDYQNNVIKKHETMRAEKEIDRINHIDCCNAHTGPIFLTYRSEAEINELVEAEKKKTPIYDFLSHDGIGQRVWRVCDAEIVGRIRAAFAKIESIYIADGHHRAGSAVRIGFKRREENPGYTGKEGFNFFLCVLFPDQQLHIMAYNRVIRDLNGNTLESFLEKVKHNFYLEKTDRENCTPECRRTFGMYVDGQWFRLTLKDDIVSENPVMELDVSILQEYILTPILGIRDLKTDQRIDFIGGIRGLSEIEKRCREDMRVGFVMYPTSMDELFEVADAGLLMPPKSTWFEPKLMSGLFIHKLD